MGRCNQPTVSGSLQVRDALVVDPDYRWALVAGYSHDYLWILARERQLPPAVLEVLLAQARSAGFATDTLLFPGGAAP